MAAAAVLIIIVTLSTGAAYGRETLHLGALISQQAGASFDYSGFLPTLALALETINNDSSLRYKFNVTINNSMVNVLIAIYSMRTIASELYLFLYTSFFGH